MDRYSPYDRPPPQSYGNGQQQQQQQQPPQQDYYRRDDYGNNRSGGGAMRDRGGRRGNDRRGDDKPYGKRSNRSGKKDYDDQDNGKEKPCRTLFVRNVQYDTNEDDIKAIFIKYGEIKSVFNLIENRGMIFVTFYDIRAAEDAKRAMQEVYLKDRKIDVHYSLPKEEEEKAKCDRTKNQGTLLYTLKNSSIELNDAELHRYFSRFGEVKVIRVPHFRKSTAHNYSPSERNQQRLVEFYDSRACVAAFDATYDTEYNGGKWDVTFFWDHPYKDRQNSHLKRERNYDNRDDRRRHEPMRQHSGGRDTYDPYNNMPPPPSSSSSYPPSLPQYNADPRLQYNPEPHNMYQPQPQPQMIPNTMGDNQRLEQAQKAQQLLSMFSQQPTAQPNTLGLPYQPTNTQSPTVQNTTVPYVQPAPPNTDNQASQLQQLLGLLSQVAAPAQQPPPQQTPPPPPQQHMSPSIMQQNVAPIPGMDAATALTQLAALLQQQQNQSQNPQ